MEYNKETLIKIDQMWKDISFNPQEVKISYIKNYIIDEHIDIIVRYLYVKSFMEKKDYEKYKKLYIKMQLKRVGKYNLEDFNKLIISFINNGYLKEYPIPINKKGKILNGSHRLACCLYFNINPYVIEFDEEDHDYNIDWFKDNNFTKNELELIINTKKELCQIYTNKEIKLEKMYVALVSPVNENKKLDVKFIENHVNYLFDNNVRGLFICGNTGNGINLDIETKKTLLNTIVNMNKFSIICHVGACTQKEIFDFVEYTNCSDIRCIASMPPYEEIKKFDEIKHFYEQLAKISNKPLIIYHIPNITGIDLSSEQLVELLKINNVIGIKYTDDNFEKLNEISKANLGKYIYFGRDDLLNNGLQNGATGGIGGCYNLFPQFIHKIINNIDENENQKKLVYCIKYLRKIYPTLPGGEFVIRSINIKKNMDDEDFYKKIKRSSK